MMRLLSHRLRTLPGSNGTKADVAASVPTKEKSLAGNLSAPTGAVMGDAGYESEQSRTREADDRIVSSKSRVIDAPGIGSTERASSQPHGPTLLVGQLAHQIGVFCTARGVLGTGTWEIEIPLDPLRFGPTTLSLSLSDYCVHLRFDAREPQIKQLLLDQCGMVEHALRSMYRACGETRDISVTVW